MRLQATHCRPGLRSAPRIQPRQWCGRGHPVPAIFRWRCCPRWRRCRSPGCAAAALPICGGTKRCQAAPAMRGPGARVAPSPLSHASRRGCLAPARRLVGWARWLPGSSRHQGFVPSLRAGPGSARAGAPARRKDSSPRHPATTPSTVAAWRARRCAIRARKRCRPGRDAGRTDPPAVRRPPPPVHRPCPAPAPASRAAPGWLPWRRPPDLRQSPGSGQVQRARGG